MKKNLATSKNLKPATPQDKVLNSFLDHIRTYTIPDREYENMDKTVYQTKGTHKFYKWESEVWN